MYGAHMVAMYLGPVLPAIKERFIVQAYVR
jgi:hypothetical protein